MFYTYSYKANPEDPDQSACSRSGPEVKIFMLNSAEHENFSANKYENANFCWHFHIY